MRILSALSTLGLLFATTAGAADWPRFRGPNGSGIAESPNLPVELSAETTVWKQEVIFGRSSPIVNGGIVFLTGLEGDELVTAAYDAGTGAELWRRSVERLRVDELATEAGPSVATPVSDGASVYSFFPEFGLVSYDSAGKERWRLQLPPFRSYYGLASSPIVEGGVLIVVCDQSLEPYIIGVDTATGKKLWQKARNVNGESWTTPVVQRSGTDQALVLVFGTFAIDAYHPRSGEPAWRLLGLGATPVASPIIEGDMLYAVAPDSGYSDTMVLLLELDHNDDGLLSREELAGTAWEYESILGWYDVNGDGLVTVLEIADKLEPLRSPDFGLVAIDLGATGPRIAWRQGKTLPYVATPILYNDVLFLVKNGGILTSYDPKTGDVLKRGRIEGAVEPFFPSPVAAAGRLYLTSSLGSIAVVSAEAEWETLGVSDLDEEIFASPAIVDGRLFLRTRSKLYAFGRE